MIGWGGESDRFTRPLSLDCGKAKSLRTSGREKTKYLSNKSFCLKAKAKASNPLALLITTHFLLLCVSVIKWWVYRRRFSAARHRREHFPTKQFKVSSLIKRNDFGLKRVLVTKHEPAVRPFSSQPKMFWATRGIMLSNQNYQPNILVVYLTRSHPQNLCWPRN